MASDLPVPGGMIPDLDAFDVDNLLTYFSQPAMQGLQEGNLAGPGVMNAHGGPNNITLPPGLAGLAMHQSIQLNPAANLFSTIAVPAIQTHQPPVAGGSDSGGQSDERGSGRQTNASVQEKNRRAQKRFRERQKAKMKDMTEHLEDMTGELGKLRMENNALKNRNCVLEKVLTLRDEHIRTMQDEQHVFDLGSPYLQTATNQKMLTSGQETGTAAPSAAALVSMDIKSIKSMPADVVINSWKDTVRDLGNTLVIVEGCADKNSKEYQEGVDTLCRILDSAGQLCMNTAVLHPTNMQRLLSASLDDGRSGASPADKQRWSSVATSLQLNDSQRGQIISLRQIFLRRMNKVMEERRGILSRLQTVSVPDRMMALQSVISETLKVNSCTAELKANLQEEHLAGLELIGTVFKTILTPIQKARAVVQSYPFYPDIFQIATALSGDTGNDMMLEYTSGGSTADAELLNVPTAYRNNK